MKELRSVLWCLAWRLVANHVYSLINYQKLTCNLHITLVNSFSCVREGKVGRALLLSLDGPLCRDGTHGYQPL